MDMGWVMSATIAVDELRVGMFIHLDLKWWAHPFALSSFRLSSPEQIATIKGLGLQQVRWSPEKSDTPAAADAPAMSADAPMADPTATGASERVSAGAETRQAHAQH